jgi:hypothetical protein
VDQVSLFVTLRRPPTKRQNKTIGEMEQVLTEAAVMLAFANHLFREFGATSVAIHPDGEHGRRFDIRSKALEVRVEPRPGRGDVVALDGDHKIIAECKGGVLNTRHAGQVSRLRRGLYEAVGMLLSRPAGNEMQFAVVPRHQETIKLATRLAARCRDCGIRIALVSGRGEVDLY